jgi:hypothetical protein
VERIDSELYSESPQGASRDASFSTRVVKRLVLDVTTGRLFKENLSIFSSSYWNTVFRKRRRLFRLVCYRKPFLRTHWGISPF